MISNAVATLFHVLSAHWAFFDPLILSQSEIVSPNNKHLIDNVASLSFRSKNRLLSLMVGTTDIRLETARESVQVTTQHYIYSSIVLSIFFSFLCTKKSLQLY